MAASARLPVRAALAVEDGALSIKIGAGEGEGRLCLVARDRQHETSVKRGENVG